MKRQRYLTLLVAASSALLLGGCDGEILEELAGLTGTEITFGASTMWQNGDDTRTEYSGDLTTTTPKYERIDWTPPTDRIRIVCAEVETDTKTLADYDLLPTATADGKVSQASIRPSSSSPTNGNGLHWGSGTHHFFAWYPAPGMASNYSSTTTVGSESSIALVSGETAATVTGTIPATQTPVSRKTTTKNNVTTTEYKPNMNYAYMYAHATGTPTGSNVLLQFKPLVTALEFTLKAGDATMATCKLKSLKLTSTSNNLTGNFTIKLKSDGGYNDSATNAYQSTGNAITVNFSDTPTLSQNSVVKATVLCLPVKQTALTVTLTLLNGSTEFTRILPLQFSDGSSIEVAATKKAYISNVGVPATTYYLTVTAPTATNYSNLGGANTFKVRSYKNTAGTNSAVKWTATFSTDDGANWSTTPPAWLYDFTTTDNTSTAEKTYSFELEANQADAGVSSTNRKNNFNKAHALDLSLYDASSSTGAKTSRNTANCYVVSRPGWYKIPCVYGNGIKNGSTNRVSYWPYGSATGYNDNNKCRNRFVNHANTEISKPWIKDNSVTINGAVLCWQDVSTATIKNVQYDSDYVYFEVDNTNNSANYVQGNAVIAAKSGSTVVWSWHIWLNSNPASDMATQKVYYPYDTFNKNVDMMKIDLGDSKAHTTAAVSKRTVKVRITQQTSNKQFEFTISQYGRNKRTDAEAFATYYQWGRKDPFPPANGSFTSPALRPLSGDLKYKKSDNCPQQADIATSIKNPNIFYRIPWNDTAHYTNWCSEWINNLWDSKNHATTDASVYKTIYDPCPYGFTVPNRDVYRGFIPTTNDSSTSPRISGSFNHGYTFYTTSGTSGTMFFRAIGLYGSSTGALSTEYGLKADRWMAVHDWTMEIDFMFDSRSNFVGPLNHTGVRGWGAGVRPIKDKNPSE